MSVPAVAKTPTVIEIGSLLLIRGSGGRTAAIIAAAVDVADALAVADGVKVA
jgi:3D (Asp-Asp-Asp) domain-containing protein